jgi:DNA-binding protein H-NS
LPWKTSTGILYNTVILFYNSESKANQSGRMSRKLNLDAMSIEEMWQLHERIAEVLSARLVSEKRELEKRLTKLRGEKGKPEEEPTRLESFSEQAKPILREGRKPARLSPKYQNPSEPSETWSGRGKQPRWLTAALLTGRKLEEFVIKTGEANSNGPQRP